MIPPFSDVKLEDEGGQSTILGAVLLLGILITVMAIYQATFVPAENKEVEFKAYEDAISEMKHLKSGYLEAASTGNVFGRTVKTGANYPSRIFFVNPPDPRGSISTTDVLTITLNNFTTETKFHDYWDGSPYNFYTRKVEFYPSYHELSVPKTTFAPWGPVYGNASGRYVLHSGQFLVDGTTLQFLVLNESIEESGYTSEIEIKNFEPYRVVTIRNDSNRPSIEVPSTMPVEKWRNDDELLKDELTSGNVYAVESAGPGRVRVVLQKETTYTLKIAGQSLPMSLIENSETVDEATGGGGGVGIAGITDHEFDTSETLSTQGGLWINIDDLDTINISEPRFVPLDGSQFDSSEKKRYFRLVFSIENSTTRYTYLLPDDKEGLNIDLENPNQFNKKQVSIYKYVKGSGSVSSIVDEKKLDENALDAWYFNGDPIDLLNPFNYENPSDVDDQLNEIRTITSGNETAEMFIGHMHGRVFMEIGSTSGAVNQAPTASFTYSPSSPSPGETITFDASGSSDPDGSITSYEWDWTNDGTYDDTGQTATHSYSTSGTYTVKLRVTDNDGATDTTTKTVDVTGGELVYNNDAVAVDGPDSPSPDRDGGVEFSVTNDFGETVTVDQITIDPVNNDIDLLDDQVTPNDQPQRVEVYAESDVDGYSDFGGGVSVPAGGLTVDIGQDGDAENSGNSPQVSAGGTMTFYLYEFFESQGWWWWDRNVDMQGEDIEITLEYTVGGGPTQTKTFTITPQ